MILEGKIGKQSAIIRTYITYSIRVRKHVADKANRMLRYTTSTLNLLVVDALGRIGLVCDFNELPLYFLSFL